MNKGHTILKKMTMDKWYLFTFSWIRIILIILTLLWLAISQVDFVSKNKILKNELAYLSDIDTVRTDIINYKSSKWSYPSWTIEEVCALLWKQGYCFSWNYFILNKGDNFVIWRYIQPLVKADLELKDWCTDDGKFYYKMANWCIVVK